MSSLQLTVLAVAAVVFSAAAFLIFVVIKQLTEGKKARTGARTLPPGPRPWPVVGNLVDLALALHYGDAGSGRNREATKRRQPQPLHAALASLSRAYGPVTHLQLGRQHVVVASSADAAREALRTQDRSLAGRAMPSAYRVPKYAEHSMVWSEDDEPRWRRLRGICRSDLLGAATLEVHAGERERKAWDMVGFLLEEANLRREVRVADVAFRAVLDMFGRMVMSRDDLAGGFQEGCRGAVDWDLKKDLAKALELGEAPNIEDFFPAIFGGWDLQGIRKEVAKVINRNYSGFGKMVSQRKGERKRQKQQVEEEGRSGYGGSQSAPHDDDLLDVLLRCGVDGTQLSAILLDLFTAAIDTTTSCIEWTMAELVKNPHVMARLKDELNSAMGEPASTTTTTPPPLRLRESELLRLPYLQACVKESLRLHPPVPLLLPHRAKEPCDLAGYRIPEGAVVLVNAWAIGRDPETWGPDALDFDPDRFLAATPGGAGHRKDFKGSDFDFIPFGSGRRACPGMALANRFVQLLVASMVYYFDWELPGGRGSGEQAVDRLVSMEEKQGLVLDRKEPLILVPKPVVGGLLA